MVKNIEQFQKNKTKKDGYALHCKSCTSDYHKTYYIKHREKILAQGVVQRIKHREKVLARSAIYREKHREELRSSGAIYRADNHEKVSISRAVYRKKNTAKIRVSNAAYYIKYSEKILTRNAAYRKENPEKARASETAWRKNNPERKRAICATWEQNNPEACKAKIHRRRARRVNADGIASGVQIEARWDYYGGKCYICGGSAEAIDHIIPLAKGGSNWPANLRPICGRCNSVKGARWPYDFKEARNLMR